MTSTTQNTYQAAFQAWKAYTDRVNAIAKRVTQARHEAGWQLAASVGIPRCGCSLHNASIDEDLKGWCANNPHRIKVAKRAAYMVDDWTASRLAERAVKRAWNRMIAKPFGFSGYTLD